ncbi:cysteinyl-tRNA synthetase [Tulasnella sp. 417]|nr:cysteinyl-tRNA synthetase [Tulasnella sp. 417]
MEPIPLSDTQQQPISSRQGSASSKKPCEPWNDIQFSVDGVVATNDSSMPGAMLGLPGAASDPYAIAPWTMDDNPVQDAPQPAPAPRRTLFRSSMSSAPITSLSTQQFTPGHQARHRGGSESLPSYVLAANGASIPDSGGISGSLGDARDVKKTLMDRGKDFGRLLGKKRDSLPSPLIPPLPYLTSITTTGLGETPTFPVPSSNPPHSSTKQKEKKWGGFSKFKSSKGKGKDHHMGGTHSSDSTPGEPEITLDTDLNKMEGIIDLNLGVHLHDPKEPTAGSHPGNENTAYIPWHGDQSGSTLWENEDGGDTLSRVNPTFTNPFEGGPPSSSPGPDVSTRPFFGHRHSSSGNVSPLPPITLMGGKRSKGHQTVPASPVLGLQPTNSRLPQDGAAPTRDPAWYAPQSWDVDKVEPEAERSSSDEDLGDDSTLGPLRDINDPEFKQMIAVGSVQGRRSSLPSPGQPRPKGGTNVFNGIGRLRTSSDFLGGGSIESGYARDGLGKDSFATSRKDSWPDEDMTARRPSGASSNSGGDYGSGYVVGCGGFRRRSEGYGEGRGIGPSYSRDGPGKGSLATSRKDSWPDKDTTARRPSDALNKFTAPQTPLPGFHIRIYRTDESYHIVECPISTVAHDLAHILRKKLSLPGQRYKLYIREHGRERVLGPQERPINILRRRLEQAGYDESDNLENLGGEDISFLLRFVFRDATLPSAQPTYEDDVLSDNNATLEYVDLTGRGLLTIPILLHRHASSIVVLDLSKNPHIDIPLDFITSCPMLRDLRLSQAAMKQVPSGVKHISTLHELDISSNRMVSLDEADLYQIPGLRNIQVQNNRLSTLPKNFAEMKALKFLNLSNNRFNSIPTVLSQITSLVDLDLSFNAISVFPPTLGELTNMERLVVVGNRIASIPPEIASLARLKEFDCRNNAITNLSAAFQCPALEILRAGNNALYEVNLVAGSRIKELSVPENERLSSFTVQPLEDGSSYALETLDLSKCMLSSFSESGLSELKKLTSLKFNDNMIRQIPNSICQLPDLEKLSGYNNHLDSLPAAIGSLLKLRALNVHNNDIKTIPASIWQCEALTDFNASSNLIATWLDPEDDTLADCAEKKPRPASWSLLPSLANSLRRLYLADNQLDEDVFRPVSRLRSLKILNLSFNDIYELPPIGRMSAFATVQELYLSGNKLASLPGEDLHKLRHLRVLFLNANKLQNIPSDLAKVKSLECLDVGGNALKYNIINWEFDWNWNFNHRLRYLNLSGNKRLEIKYRVHDTTRAGREPLMGFGSLGYLKLLGLMDVTLGGDLQVPNETEDRRIRTSDSQVGGMAYGISDTLGKLDTTDRRNNVGLSMFDLVVPSFRGRDNECLFGMFGRHVPIQWGNRPTSNKLPKYLQQQFSQSFAESLRALQPGGVEDVGDALRRAFLSLNKGFYRCLDEQRNSRANHKLSATSSVPPDGLDYNSGSSGLVLYIVDEADRKVMHVANVGSILAVVSRKGGAMVVSYNHQPFDPMETDRIRAAEGWVSPKGLVNDQLEISRSFGVYHLLPAVNARPFVQTVSLTDQDDFVIIGNRGLWDYITPQRAVDIARLNKNEPMIAAQQLRDYAMSYGAEGSTMIMVISVKDIFQPKPYKNLLGHKDEVILERTRRRRAERAIEGCPPARLKDEIPPPIGLVALVFTGIPNSTMLWEKNPGMPTAIRIHNSLLRRQLRVVGGYEVKTEGDTFFNSFPSIEAALLWCFNVQVQLMQEEWPQSILESEDGQEVHNENGDLLARGLSVRMGIHWGTPYCEPDPITGRMDYFGATVGRSAQFRGAADGGQIMVSNKVVQEILAILPMDESKTGLLTSLDNQPLIDGNPTSAAIHRMGVVIKDMGEFRLKGLEVPETLSLVYPKELAGRLKLGARNFTSKLAPNRIQFSLEQLRSLARLAIRIEALASDRVFRPTAIMHRSYSLQPTKRANDPNNFTHADVEFLLPPIDDNATEAHLLQIIDSLTLRIENALLVIYLKHVGGYHSVLAALEQATKVDAGILIRALSMLESLTE